MLKWIVVLLIVLIIFGAGKLPKIMGDLGRGLKNFKKELDNDEAEKVEDDETKPEGRVIDVKPEKTTRDEK